MFRNWIARSQHLLESNKTASELQSIHGKVE